MMLGPESLLVVVAALALDALIGDPDWLWRRMPHPIVVIGWLINALDQRLNQETWSPAPTEGGGDRRWSFCLRSQASSLDIRSNACCWPCLAGPLWVAVVASIFIAQREPLSARRPCCRSLRNWRPSRGTPGRGDDCGPRHHAAR